LVCLLKDIDLQLFGVLQVVASQDWPEVTKYAGLVSAQAHRQELIEDLYNVTHDPQRGTIHGGMIRYAQRDPHKNLDFSSFCCTFRLKSCIHSVALHLQGASYILQKINRREASAHIILQVSSIAEIYPCFKPNDF
jgi:hypothetical protein